ncbi:MAG: sensor domain-containing diguanylate cyclase [Pseudomonadales bacterium]|nr:sensor domain-containing diguanylate cyclase [Pseudomonadales bacterium]MCP5329983.1 sensor domain-containing diguanylate cyclase [Pseudomonadales bacterium]MCP5343109.1 sensor domain-containing diguanylate cyclase [Pseudomonadales bacterium]
MVHQFGFEPAELAPRGRNCKIALPTAFIHDMASADSLQKALDTLAHWLSVIFSADRASITIQRSPEELNVYSMVGNRAIPQNFTLPVHGTLVGRAFSTQRLLICNDLNESEDLDCLLLAEHELGSCMDAPMVQGNTCVGTLNIAHREKGAYQIDHAMTLQCLANWMAMNVRLHQQISEMETLARTDALTGIANRRSFIETGKVRLRDFQENGSRFVVGILDLDFFKQVNDQHGHDMGDLVLIALSNCVQGQLRNIDHLSRMGGEEFAVILPGVSYDEARHVFEKIRGCVEQIRIPLEQVQLRLTTSIGFSEVAAADQIFEDVLKRADLALYRAKSGGRNRVEAH